jgi:hypothetical protein
MNDPQFRLSQIVAHLKARGVTFQPNGLNLFYDSAQEAVFVVRGNDMTDRIPMDDPRLLDKLAAQSLHLLEYFDT